MDGKRSESEEITSTHLRSEIQNRFKPKKELPWDRTGLPAKEASWSSCKSHMTSDQSSTTAMMKTTTRFPLSSLLGTLDFSANTTTDQNTKNLQQKSRRNHLPYPRPCDPCFKMPARSGGSDAKEPIDGIWREITRADQEAPWI